MTGPPQPPVVIVLSCISDSIAALRLRGWTATGGPGESGSRFERRNHASAQTVSSPDALEKVRNGSPVRVRLAGPDCRCQGRGSELAAASRELEGPYAWVVSGRSICSTAYPASAEAAMRGFQRASLRSSDPGTRFDTSPGMGLPGAAGDPGRFRSNDGPSSGLVADQPSLMPVGDGRQAPAPLTDLSLPTRIARPLALELRPQSVEQLFGLRG